MQRMLAGLCGLISALAFVGAVAAGGKAQPEPATVCPGEVTDSDVPIQVAPRQRFVIVLASNPTTGYSWAIGEQPEAAVVTEVSHTYISGGSGLPGAGGRECWVFQAVGAGETAIGMIYQRPFDPPQTEPARTAVFIVEVR